MNVRNVDRVASVLTLLMAASVGTALGSEGSTDVSMHREKTETAAVPAPAWVFDIPVGTWAPVSLNTIVDVDPADDTDANPNYPNSAPWSGATGQASIIDSWNGGAFADRYGSHGSLILFGGGHADYYGSEVYAFDMASRRWNRVTNPYPGPFNWPYTNSEYPDGSPVPPHTYSFSAYDPATNSYVLIKGQNELGHVSGFGSQEDIAHMFSFDTMSWRRSKYAPAPRPRLYTGGWAVYDSTRGIIWSEGGSGGDFMIAFDPITDNGDGTYGTWSDNYPLKTTHTNTVADYDPVNDIIVILPWREDDRVAAIDVANPDRNEVYLNVTGAAPNVRQSTGISWSRANAAFLQYGSSGANVYELKLVSGDWDDGTWRWTLITGESNTVLPQPNSNGVFDRFQVVTYSDAEVAVVVNSVDGPVYAFRVPESVRPEPPRNVTAN